MSIVQFKFLSEICLIAGMIVLIISAIIFIKFDIYKAWHFITGRRLKEVKKDKSKINNVKVQNCNNYAIEDYNYSDKNCTKQMTEVTEKLQPQDMPDYTQEETTLLETNKKDFCIVYEITYIHANGI